MKQKKHRSLITGITTGLLFLTSQCAWSVSLNLAGDYAINGTTSAARPELAGVVLEDLITSYSFTGLAGQTLEGTIQNRVVRSADGTLDFYWRIRSTGGNDDIDAFRVTGFDGFNLDADWRLDGLGSAAPDTARYFGPGSGSVNFLFDTNPVGLDVTGAYDDSMFFFLDTDATSYDFSGQFDLVCANSGCISESYSTFAPSAVPLPAAAWLMISGLLGLVGIGTRRSL